MGRPKLPERTRPDNITDKKCSCCGEIKAIAYFGLYYGRNMRSADGYRAMCNDCRSAKRRAAYAKNRGV